MTAHPTRSTISFRVGTPIWLDPEKFEGLMTLLERYRGTIDEVACFTGWTHPPRPFSVIEEWAEVLKDRMPRMREVIPSVGINHLATIGHLNENLPNSLREPWQRLMGIDGETVEGCFCPSDERFRGYVRNVYIALAQAKPDFIWVDDDIRFESHSGVQTTCFCDTCVGIFSRETGREWTREQLKEAMDSGEAESKIAARKSWLEHNRKKIVRLTDLIRESVDTVDPGMKLGQMTGEIHYSGLGFDRWAKSLSGPNKIEVKWRPGGGFYTDNSMFELVDKAHGIGHQIAEIPPEVVDIQSEIENFPYQVLKKSPHVTLLECAAYIGAGCTGAALNVAGSPDPLDEYYPIFDKVRDSRAFLDAAVAAFGRSACEGVWAAANQDSGATPKLDGGWFGHAWGAGLNFGRELSDIGLPTSYTKAGSSVALLSGDTCFAFSKDDLKEILSGGVMIDGAALKRLNEMGLSVYTGFEIVETRAVDTIERLTDDEMNGPHAGWWRDTRPSFWSQLAYVLKPKSDSCRMLSEVIDFTDTSYGPTSGISQNEFGGRVAVFGYSPWFLVQNLCKTEQLKSVARWLSRDTLPAYAASYNKATLWCRRSPEGRRSILLLNAYHDPAPSIRLNVLGQQQSMNLMRTNGRIENVPVTGHDGPYTVFELPELSPWEIVLLTGN